MLYHVFEALIISLFVNNAVSDLATLRSLAAGLPSPVGYWPLSSQFSTRDASANHIDGTWVGSVGATVAGPSGCTGGVKTGSNYVLFQSNMFTTLPSWTIASYIKMTGVADSVPILEFNSGTAVSTNIRYYYPWSYDYLQLSYTATGTTTRLMCSALGTTSWIWIAATFNKATGTRTIYCGTSTNPDVYAGGTLASSLTLGVRAIGTLDTSGASFACTSVYNASMSSTQISQLQQMCSHYQNIVCSPNCVADTCRAAISATNGYTCSACYPGWTSIDCTVPICVIPCLNGGNCTAPETCTCPAAFTGVGCVIPIGNSGTVYGYILTLKTISNALPSLIAYWPLSSQFSLRDATLNHIDGTWTTSPGTTATGPFAVANTAMKVGSLSQYIWYQSNLFSAVTSWTLATYVNTNSAGIGPLLEFYNGTYTYSYLWQYPTINTITLSNLVGGVAASVSCNGLASTWMFVAAGYNSATGERFFVCNGTLTTQTATTAYLTADRLTAGSRVVGTTQAIAASFACTSIFGSALNYGQLLELMRMCSPYQSITCSSHCVTDTCRADITAPNGYTCSACIDGWTSADCTVPICLLSCINGGTCTSAETCTCPAAFTGAGCTIPIGNSTTIYGNLLQLRTISSIIPTPIAYWPLSSQFGLRDATTNLIDGAWTSTQGSIVTGPFGVSNTAVKVGSLSQYVLYQSSLFSAATSWTFATYVNTNSAGLGPLLEFNDGSAVYSLLWQSPSLNTLMLRGGASAIATTVTCTGLGTSTWIFVAAGYNSVNSASFLFCNGALTSQSSPTILQTASRLTAGTRVVQGAQVLSASFSCSSVFADALNYGQLVELMRMCQPIQAITCSTNCASNVCRANINATNGFTCSSCINGWALPDCTTAICVVPCANGGTCTLPETCTCAAGYTGAGCSIAVSAVGTASGNLLQLKAIFNALPRPVAYWPLSSRYSLRDVGSNKIDGYWPCNSGTSVAGPFGVANTGYKTGTSTYSGFFGCSRQYIRYDSNAFTASTSWTLATYVNIGYNGNGPVLEFNDGWSTYANLWANPYTNTAAVSYNSGSGGFTSACASTYNKWVFIAAGYNSATKARFMFCNGTRPAQSSTIAHSPASSLTAGFRELGWPVAVSSSFACTSFHGSALSYGQLIELMRMCSFYQSLPCTNCASSCRADPTLPNGYNCSNICTDGWTSYDCSLPDCMIPCANGGTCVATDVCACPAAWTGVGCVIPIAQAGTASSTVTQLKLLDWTLPDPYSYWPLSAQFGLRDSGRHRSDGAWVGTTGTIVTGPYGIANTSVRTGTAITPTTSKYIQYNSPNEGDNRWENLDAFTLSTFVNMNGAGVGPILEFNNFLGPLINLWQNGTGTLRLYSSASSTSSVASITCPTLANGWLFIALTYRKVGRYNPVRYIDLYCNNTLVSTSTTTSLYPSRQLVAGFRYTGRCLDWRCQQKSYTYGPAVSASFACTSLSYALSPRQIGRLMQICPLYQNVVCSPNCLPNTCRADPGATYGYTCVCVGNNLWAFPDCVKPICLEPCKNGGTCVSPGVCVCTADWTDRRCKTRMCNPSCRNGGSCHRLGYCNCFSPWYGVDCGTTLAAAKAVANSLPVQLSFWPLAKQFGLRDSGPYKIDGVFVNSNASSVVGPFGLPDTAYQTGNTTTGTTRYISYTSSRLDVGIASSWTLATFVNMNGYSTGPILEFLDVTTFSTYKAGIWEYSSADQLWFNPLNPDSGHSLSCPGLSNSWRFIAAGYDKATNQGFLFCDSTMSSPFSVTGAPDTEQTLLTGFRKYSSPTAVAASFACTAFYSSSLSAAQLLQVKEMCGYYLTIACSLNCANDSCRADLSAPFGFTCSSCQPGWTGVDCLSPICSPPCQNGGTCTDPETCFCPDTYEGPTCEQPVCTPECAKGGNCTAPDVCTCASGYTDPLCSTPICEPPCENNGTCIDAGVCQCTDEFTGDTCELPFCSPQCENNATCSAPYTCNCTEGWIGQSCSAPICDTITCLNNGTCLKPGNCLCEEPYTGSDCSSFICDPPCFNGGCCTEPYLCTCLPGYTGYVCEEPICSLGCEITGQCVAPETCNCTVGWNGTTCGTPICTRPCQNSGTCVAPDVCVCVDGYTGIDCGTAICDPPCFNGGSCSTPYVCTCSHGYTGSACETPICTPACAILTGQCVAPDVCSCTTGWKDATCSTPICTKLCQNGGTCVAPDVCSCSYGYTGVDCTTVICDPPCSSGAYCSGPYTCTCIAGYTGTNCDQPICTHPCLNNGTCVLPDTCSCTQYWTGVTCETPVCTQPCHNGGTCSDPDTCTCLTGAWEGQTCDQPICNSPCMNNGTCVRPDTCSCTQSWTGATCETPVCIQACQNGGTCSDPDTCTCRTGLWEGEACEIPICTIPCENGGSCVSPNRCGCTADWTGLQCTIPVCKLSCENGGVCSAPNICSCNSRWTGSRCTIPICQSPCQNGGSCSAPDTCSCSYGWDGLTCTYPTCALPCMNNGVCVAPDTCQCTWGWTGPICTTPVCSSGCMNGGICVAPDICSCTSKWQGTICDIPVCSTGCTHGGTCVAPDECACTSQWSGDFCETPVCNPRCQNGGSCIAPDLCLCTPFWKGDHCELMYCHPNCTEEEFHPKQTEPLSIAFLRNVSDNFHIAEPPTVCNWVAATSQAIVNQAPAAEIVPRALEFVTTLQEEFERYAALDLPPDVMANISLAFSAALDELMATMTNGTGSDDFDMDAGSVKCVISKSSSESPSLAPTTSITSDELQALYNRFTKLLQSMVAMMKDVLNSGADFKFDGAFFAVKIFNVEFSKVPGLELKTLLGRATFPSLQAGNSSSILIDVPLSLTERTTVSTSVIAYIANVLDVKKPFNMPTISVGITYNKKQLKLNPKTSIRVVGNPIIKKKMLFSSQKKDAQCDISKIKCDLKTNANLLGSLVKFPMKKNSGDFMLIFPIDPFDYAAYIAFNDTPNWQNFTWNMNVSTTDVIVTENADYPPIRFNYNKGVELRVLVSGEAITKFLEDTLGSESNQSLPMNVFMKRDLSAYLNQESMPEGACELQRCYGYYIRVGPAAATFKAAHRKKRSADDNETSSNPDDFELDPGSTEGAVAFKTNYFGDFGADLIITPNTIQFSDIFANFATLLAENAAVFTFQIFAVVFFLVGIVFCVRFDRQDLIEWAFLPIISNQRKQPCYYLVSVAHFAVKGFEQKPLVWIRLLGDVHDTEWRLLEDGKRKANFKGKKPANFTLATWIPVGRIDAIELRVDTLLKPAEKFRIHMDKVIIIDIEKARKYLFLVRKTMKPGQIEKADLPTEDEINSFRYLVTAHSRVGISETHPWISTAQRPLPSNWTRAERLGCVVSALFMAMLVNTMFYGKEETAPKTGVNVGGYFRISWFTIWTSVVSSIIIIPPTSIMAFIFKHIKRRSAEHSHLATVFNIKLPAIPDVDEETGKKAKKPLVLPFWTVYFAWILVAICIGVSAFFVILYSLSWGQAKSIQWLTGMALHVVQDIIIIQTVKVVVVSIFSSTFLALPDDGLNIGKLTFAKGNTKRESELFHRTRNMIVSIGHHILYVIAFGLVIGTTTNFYANRQVRDIKPLVTFPGSLEPVSSVITDYSAVYDYLNVKLLPNFLNGNQLAYGGLFYASNIYKIPNHDIVLIGPIRLRQQRTAKDTCPLQARFVPDYTQHFANGLANSSIVRCQKVYVDSFGFGDSSEVRTFNSSWQTPSQNRLTDPQVLSNLSTEQAPWTYRESDGVPYSGWQANYKTGGYYVDLPTRLSKARAVVSDLNSKRWLDNSTTVLVVDFTLYNAQINIFLAAKIVFEALDAGGMNYHVRISPLNLYQYSGSNAMLAYAIQGIWIIVLLTHAIKILWQIKKQGVRTYFKDGWNIFNVCQVLFSLGIVGLFAARIYNIFGTITQMQSDRSSFTSLDLLVNWEDLMRNLYGIAFFMTMMLFFRNLKSNKFWAIFLGTLSHGKYEIASFIGLFTLITVMFAGLGYGTMGASRVEFRTFTASLMTLVQNVIGVNGSLMSLSYTSRFILVYCLAYSSIVMFIAVQIFMAIISFVYSYVASDVETKTNWDAELSEYISKQFSEVLKKKEVKKGGFLCQLQSHFRQSQSTAKTTLGKLGKATEFLDKVAEHVLADDKKSSRRMLAWAAGFHRLPPQRRPILLSARCRKGSLDPTNSCSSDEKDTNGLFTRPQIRQIDENGKCEDVVESNSQREAKSIAKPETKKWLHGEQASNMEPIKSNRQMEAKPIVKPEAKLVTKKCQGSDEEEIWESECKPAKFMPTENKAWRQQKVVQLSRYEMVEPDEDSVPSDLRSQVHLPEIFNEPGELNPAPVVEEREDFVLCPTMTASVDDDGFVGETYLFR